MTGETRDVVVIGSGAGGSAAAWALAKAGVDVLLLEAGPRYDYLSDYRLDRPDWEQTGFPEKVPTATRQTFAPLQPLEERWQDLRSWNVIRGAKVSGDRRSPRGGYKHVVGLGGTTLYFTGEYHRMNPAAMRMFSDYGVAADWPVGYDELEPFYTEVENLVGTSGLGSGPGRRRSGPYPCPPLPVSYASRALATGFDAMGLTFEPNPLAVLSVPYDDRPPCNFCGGCNRGCPRGDKGTADVTFLRHAEATGRCEIRTGAEVVRLERGRDDRIAQVIYRQGGEEHAVSPTAVVVACGAVETPRLLLNSATGGLANGSGQLGRNFMETLSWVTVGLHPDPIGSHRGHPSDSICWDFNHPNAVDGIVGGFRLSPATAESNMSGPINYAARVVGGFGLEHKRRMRESFGRAIGLGAFGESLPNARSLVDLDPEERDAHGMPKARIHSYLAEHDILRLEAMASTVRDVLGAAGISRRIEESGTYDEFGSSHVFGTCRMGVDPATSVTDPWGQSHEIANLFIADASVFPSSGGGESPSLTISALAIRTARRLINL
ncbi:GMC family oxidoreductase [Rhodobacteraceae bacterium NNCM2]|nr:GMC family oxidoreductase [Coraliihabitans acroporae]